MPGVWMRRGFELSDGRLGSKAREWKIWRDLMGTSNELSTGCWLHTLRSRLMDRGMDLIPLKLEPNYTVFILG
jgi:hypothetical protein